MKTKADRSRDKKETVIQNNRKKVKKARSKTDRQRGRGTDKHDVRYRKRISQDYISHWLLFATIEY